MATPVHELDLPTLDLLTSTGPDDSKTRLAAARDQHWIARGTVGFVVLRYEDSVGILRDRRFHSAVSLIPQMQGVTDEKFLSRRRESILTAEGDVHGRLRRLVAPAFTPKAADRLRPFMREVVERLIDPIAPQGRCELVADVCDPYPIPIICRLLGAPEQDWKLFSRWAADILRIFNNNLAEDLPVIMAAQDEMDDYVLELIERRRHEPGEDLLTDMIAAEEAGDRLSSDELTMMANAVLIGGTDTTRNQLGCIVGLMADHPEQWALLAERPELAPRAVEESMRFLGAVRGTARFASEDIEYRGVLFPKGTLVMTNFVAGNFDPNTWTDPERFDITKEAAHSPHLTFGSGLHYCLGAWLARAELQEALPILARRLRDLRVDGAIEWKPLSFGIWGAERLPLRFTPER